ILPSTTDYPSDVDVTTIADDMVVLHHGTMTTRRNELRPQTIYEFDGVTARTLPRPDGEMLCRFATVNDVHFGEVECGRMDGRTDGPIQRRESHETPHPELMNRARRNRRGIRSLRGVLPTSFR
ncbi:MAG: hypothetical protein RLZ86_1793, partial [Actinomycetota bacterium]